MSDLLRMDGIVKRYGSGVLANNNACFSLDEGEIHAIAGENGAGKSTLMKILFGVEQPDAGEIILRGQKVNITSPKAAGALGIGMVFQHFMLVNELPVYENVFLGMEKSRYGLLDRKTMIERTRQLCEKYGMPLNAEALCGDLSVSLRQKVEILKVLARENRIIILDEPTAVLTPQETEQLFEQLRLLRADGHTIILITHKLNEIKALCDRITVMRRGETVGTYPVEGLSLQQMSELMVGGAVQLKVDKTSAEPGETVLFVSGVSLSGHGKKELLRNVSFEAKRGEIVCFAGVEGNGQQEMAEIIAGLNRRYTGMVRVLGGDPSKMSVRMIRSLGVAHIPADRMTVGTDQKASIYDNLIAVKHNSNSALGFLRRGKMRSEGEKLIRAYQVKGTLDDSISSLSGGNMQKVVTARETDECGGLLIADQPTRGVDVGAISFIHRQLVALRDTGNCIILISADMSEVFALADRIIVFYGGEITACITDPECVDEQQLGRYMLGVERMEAEK